MSVDLTEFDEAKEKDTWLVLSGCVGDLDLPNWSEQVSVSQLMTPPIASRLADLFLRLHCKHKTTSFLTDEQLSDIASEDMGRGRTKSENDIDETPGIYIFVSLVGKEVLKVGQAANMRERIAKGHLRYGNEQSLSDLIVYCRSRWEAWPEPLLEQEITALLFPMRASSEKERCFIESGLQELLPCPMP